MTRYGKGSSPENKIISWQGAPTWIACQLVLWPADVALPGEAGTGLGEWLAPVAEECQPGTGMGPRLPGSRWEAAVRRGAASGMAAAAAAAACTGTD